MPVVERERVQERRRSVGLAVRVMAKIHERHLPRGVGMLRDLGHDAVGRLVSIDRLARASEVPSRGSGRVDGERSGDGDPRVGAKAALDLTVLDRVDARIDEANSGLLGASDERSVKAEGAEP